MQQNLALVSIYILYVYMCGLVMLKKEIINCFIGGHNDRYARAHLCRVHRENITQMLVMKQTYRKQWTDKFETIKRANRCSKGI